MHEQDEAIKIRNDMILKSPLQRARNVSRVERQQIIMNATEDRREREKLGKTVAVTHN